MLPLVALVVLATSDSARIVGNRIVIEPAGVSVAIPPSWFDSTRLPPGHCFLNQPAAFYAPLSATRAELAGARTGWHREYSTVADSVLPLVEAVAHFGRLSWQAPPCYGELQARIYVSEFTIDEVIARVETVGVQTATRFFPASVSIADTAGWKRARITWNAIYGDFGDRVSMDYYVRVHRGRAVVLLLMYTHHSISRPFEDAATVLASWRSSDR